MKKAIFIIFCLFIFAGIGNAFSNSVPFDYTVSDIADGEIIFHNKHVKLKSLPSAKLDYLAFASYNESNQYFSLKTFKELQMIQVLNQDGELEFQIPINGNLIHLSLNNFEAGNYSLNVMFAGEEDFLEMGLEVN